MKAETGSVELIGVTKSFGTVKAVDSLYIQVRPAEFLSLLGPSGCGKTTTLRMLAGFEDPDEGEIRISGNVVQGVPPTDAAPDLALLHLLLAQAVRDALRDRHVREQRVVLANRKPREMSGGQPRKYLFLTWATDAKTKPSPFLDELGV